MLLVRLSAGMRARCWPKSLYEGGIVRYSVGIGSREEVFTISDDISVDVMHAKEVTASADEATIVRTSLEHPIGSPCLSELVNADKSVLIITSDVTRPVPTARILPVLMDQLHSCGVADENVTLAIALGSHRAQTGQELERIMGEYYGKLCVINGNTREMIHVGETAKGTPVDIFAEVLDADIRIGIGNVEYHYFAGYSGGAKAIMPGMSTFEAIQANHSLMVDPAAHAGNVESPVRIDLEEACSMVGLEFIVNVVLDEEKRIVYCASGDYIEAHRDACNKLDELYGCPIERQYDVVIASQGGSPKDLNLYQTQKALDNAKNAVRDGGTIILVGSCKEGFGQPTFEKWLIESESPQDVIDRLAACFTLGGHKAAAMAQVFQRANVFLVSDLNSELVERCFMKPFSSVQDAVDSLIMPSDDRLEVLIMPHAGSTLPLFQ